MDKKSSIICYKAVFVIAIVFILLLVIGLYTDICLGDECTHFRIAAIMEQTGQRPAYDPLMHYSDVAKRYFLSNICWHYGLAIFGKMLGGVTAFTAQLYQALYFVLMAVYTFLLAKKIYGDDVALNSILVLISIPMVPILLVVLHTDIPIAAVTVVCFYMIYTQRYFATGILVGLMFLMKGTFYLVAPAILYFVIFNLDGRVKGCLKRLLCVIVPAILIIAPDALFRIKNYGFTSFCVTPITPAELHVPYLGELHVPEASEPIHVEFVDVSNPIQDHKVIFTHFGLLLFLCLVVYLSRRKNKREDVFLLLPIMSVLIIFLILTFFLGIAPMLRYLSVILPFLAITGAIGLHMLNRKWLRQVILIGCAVQFILACGYIYHKRRVPVEIKEAYIYVRDRLPKDTRIMTPGDAALSFWTGRISHWCSPYCYRELDYFFWRANEEDRLRIIKRYGTNYIFVEKDRIYNDLEIYQLHDYPKTFIEEIPKLSFLKKVFENDAVVIWEIRET